MQPVIADNPESSAAPAIIVTNLVKQFGRFAALRGVTAEFAAGRLYAILGDNGAGKTTLLRTLAGIIAADARQRFAFWIEGCSFSLRTDRLHGASIAAV